MATVEIVGDIARLLRQASAPQLEAIAKRAEVALQRNVPRDTGELAASCFAKADANAGTVTIGATAKHAPFVEYGFTHYRSGKFIGPNAFVRKSLNEAIRATGGGRR